MYKWLEAIGWVLADPELTETAEARLQEFLDSSHLLLGKVQEEDGYLDSYFQVLFPGERFQQLRWGHELYCIGHLIQAAVALHRTTADGRVLDVARRAADLVTRTFGTGDGQVDGVCGHPEIETALVELFRETGERSYLVTAQYFLDRRGHGLLGADRFGAPTGKIICRSARPRRPKVMRFASSTCSPESPTCMPRSGDATLLEAANGSGVRWSPRRPT